MLRFRRGFTLIELLVVILIISILMSVLLPVLGHVLKVADQAAAETIASQAVQAVTMLEQTTMQLPPGDGHGSRGLVKALSAPGPKKLPYLEIREDMVTPEGDLINPVHPDGEPPLHVFHYRNNRGRKPGPDGVGRPGISERREYDLWAAGMDYDPNRPDSAWSIFRP
jgi:prepilin-type N-terminal cleavage/methylation domain-containing protein